MCEYLRVKGILILKKKKQKAIKHTCCNIGVAYLSGNLSNCLSSSCIDGRSSSPLHPSSISPPHRLPSFLPLLHPPTHWSRRRTTLPRLLSSSHPHHSLASPPSPLALSPSTLSKKSSRPKMKKARMKMRENTRWSPCCLHS